MRSVYAILAALLLALPVMQARPAQAAAPLNFILHNGEAFRHVLELGDWLVLARTSLIPTTQTAFADTFSVTTTGGDFDDPVTLINRVHVTDAFSTDVTVVAGATITAACQLLQDGQTVNCTSTGLADDTYSVTVTYRSGWSAYSAQDVFVRLLDGATIAAENTPGRVGCGLVGIYLTAADVTALGLTWADGGITLSGVASPALWAVPSSDTGTITWQSTSTIAETATTLTTRLKTMLIQIEQDGACGITSGTLNQADFITNEGLIMSLEAFGSFRVAIPEAFASSRINPFPTAITTPTASLVTAVETQVAATTVYQDVQAIHPIFGLLLTLIGSVVLGGVAWSMTKSSYLAVMAWYATLMTGWLLFAIPFAIVFLPAAGLAALGFMWLSKRIFSTA